MVLLKQKLWIDLKFNTKLLEPLTKNQDVISITIEESTGNQLKSPNID